MIASPTDSQRRAAKKWRSWPNYLDEHLQQPKHFVDVGANIGYSTLFFHFYWRSVRITAIEPIKRNYDYLLRNLRGRQRVITVRAACGAENGTLVLSLPDKADNLGLYSAVWGDGWKAEEVPLVRLDDLIVDTVDFIKIDVEGYELEVLKGAAGILEKNGPLLQIEQNDDAHAWLLEHEYRYKTRWKGDSLYERIRA